MTRKRMCKGGEECPEWSNCRIVINVENVRPIKYIVKISLYILYYKESHDVSVMSLAQVTPS